MEIPPGEGGTLLVIENLNSLQLPLPLEIGGFFLAKMCSEGWYFFLGEDFSKAGIVVTAKFHWNGEEEAPPNTLHTNTTNYGVSCVG